MDHMMKCCCEKQEEIMRARSNLRTLLFATGTLILLGHTHSNLKLNSDIFLIIIKFFEEVYKINLNFSKIQSDFWPVDVFEIAKTASVCTGHSCLFCS